MRARKLVRADISYRYPLLRYRIIHGSCQYVFVAVNCPAVPTAGRNSLADTSNRLLETVVTYQCNVGHYYSDYYNTTSQRLAIECEERGGKVEWNTTEIIPDCLRESFYIFIWHMVTSFSMGFFRCFIYMLINLVVCMTMVDIMYSGTSLEVTLGIEED